MKAEIEREMANLEEKIRQYERPKVFVKIEDWEKSIQKISVRKKSVQKKFKEEEKNQETILHTFSYILHPPKITNW